MVELVDLKRNKKKCGDFGSKNTTHMHSSVCDNNLSCSVFTVEGQLQRGHTGSAEGSEGEERNLAAVLQNSYSLLQ